VSVWGVWGVVVALVAGLCACDAGDGGAGAGDVGVEVLSPDGGAWDTSVGGDVGAGAWAMALVTAMAWGTRIRMWTRTIDREVRDVRNIRITR